MSIYYFFPFFKMFAGIKWNNIQVPWSSHVFILLGCWCDRCCTCSQIYLFMSFIFGVSLFPCFLLFSGATEAFVEVGKLNKELSERSKKHLAEYVSNRKRKSGDNGDDLVGSCDFNMTLINRCFPEGRIFYLSRNLSTLSNPLSLFTDISAI